MRGCPSAILRRAGLARVPSGRRLHKYLTHLDEEQADTLFEGGARVGFRAAPFG